tara:strand:+ start:7536 stop:8030 length:495 start_codon:yes stop_codon:yes gene_type:complete
MIKNLFIVLILFSIPSYGLDLLQANNAMNMDYSFEEIIYDDEIPIQISQGTIRRLDSSIVINIYSDFSEEYIINSTSILITDKDLNQTQEITLDQIHNPVIEILVNGIKSQSDQYGYELIDNFLIITNDRYKAELKFDNDYLTKITYVDDFNYKHVIKLKVVLG